jgi:hypothetical protein
MAPFSGSVGALSSCSHFPWPFQLQEGPGGGKKLCAEYVPQSFVSLLKPALQNLLGSRTWLFPDFEFLFEGKK